MMKSKSLIYKIILVLVLIVICLIMIYIGRGHTLYFDNKGIILEDDVAGAELKAPYRIKVFIKGKEVANLNDGDRGMAIWIGPKAHLELEVTEEKGGEKEKIAFDVPLPRAYDGVVINLVGLINAEPYDTYISEFIPLATVTSESEEEVVLDEMGGLGFGE